MRSTTALLPLLLLAACTRAPEPPPPAPEPVAMPAAVPEPAPTPATAPAQVLLALSCAGEPGWTLDIGGDGRGELRADSGDVDLVGRLEPAGSGHAYRAAPEDAPSETFAALITPAACFPAEEGAAALAYSVQLSFADGRQAAGCCSGETGLDVLAAPAFVAADADDWSRRLATAAGPIVRCALDGGVDTRAVIGVREPAPGKLAVRLRDSDDARFDCLIDLQDGDIEAVGPADDADADEGRSEWLPADPDVFPRLQCGSVFRDVDEAGELRGWVHRRDGC